MLSSISLSNLYVLDQDEALEFYVGKLGLEVRDDVDYGFMRAARPVRQPDPDRPAEGGLRAAARSLTVPGRLDRPGTARAPPAPARTRPRTRGPEPPR